MTKNILVTGGAGYIGSHTAALLAEQGYNPIIFDNLCRGHKWAALDSKLVEGDLADKALIEKTLKENNIEAVIHFAAHSQVGESVEKPAIYFRNNVANTLNLLEAMVASNVKTLVFSSTAATYGIPDVDLVTEDTLQAPINPYGESKLMMERMIKWFGEAYGLKWIALRYFNAAGADPQVRLGQKYDSYTHIIPLTLLAALGERESIKIFGTDYDTPDGTAIRDYIHVTDLSDAHIKALEYMEKGGESSAFNLGTSSGHSVREVIECARKVTSKDIRAEETGRRAGDPPVLVADATTAKKMLNWTPKLSDLETIIQTAWAWHQKDI